jgi:hypothetical protein
MKSMHEDFMNVHRQVPIKIFVEVENFFKIIFVWFLNKFFLLTKDKFGKNKIDRM